MLHQDVNSFFLDGVQSRSRTTTGTIVDRNDLHLVPANALPGQHFLPYQLKFHQILRGAIMPKFCV